MNIFLLGTANFCRNSFIPDNAEEGLSGNVSPDRKGNVGCYGNLTSFSEDELKGLDAEGRTVITQHTVRYCIFKLSCLQVLVDFISEI